MSDSTTQDFFKSKVLGHPSGLFVLFFTEMWERFSFYGMRVLLINFLTMAAVGSNPGWAWTSENAGALFGTYAGLLYVTPIIGGIIADRFTGYRWAVVIGALIMTLGHAAMALETEFSLYAGLALLVIGTGFFKPNITSIISQMYKDLPEKKDGAYTIFYMGVNAGAFFGMMLCGYLAEKIGWSWGFGLAGIFMLLGSLQFWLAKPLFGTIGDKPKKLTEATAKQDEAPTYKSNPFTIIDKVLIAVTSVIGLLYLLNDPLSKIGNVHLLPQTFLIDNSILSGPSVIIIIGLILFLILAISRILRYDSILRDRMFVVIIFVFFTVFFVLSFEQGATSLVLFARDFTNRTFEGAEATAFIIVNTLLTVGPLLIISWVIFKLVRQTFNKIALSNVILAISFIGVWGLVIWMLNRDLNSHAYEMSYQTYSVAKTDAAGKEIKDKEGKTIMLDKVVTESTPLSASTTATTQKETFSAQEVLKVGDVVNVHHEGGKVKYLTTKQTEEVRKQYAAKSKASLVASAQITQLKDSQVEITTSWFSILNSFFIIAFASFVSKIWESRFNVSAPVKFGLGLIITAIGFGLLAYGSKIIPQGAAPGSIRVSMIWLILAYLFHTLGELCIQPVGLSYVSKLVPGKMIAFMFGMWYLAIAIGNKLAGTLGGKIEEITSKYDMSTFFLIFTIVPVVAGLIIMSLSPAIKKLMHGVR